ncbi:MAG TPA: winged helix-turn-helix domain-containing protein [Candidatus Baltobacteraceae bacterium]|nr:winged helix-turn-helix domain-containing protein [Candidatus Baltobacteraceae bacterium]
MGTYPTRTEYRDKLEVKAQVLQILDNAGAEGLIASTVGRFANMAHARTLLCFDELKARELIEIVRINKSTVYRINDKGKTALAKYKEVRSMLILRTEGLKPSILDNED